MALAARNQAAAFQFVLRRIADALELLTEAVNYAIGYTEHLSLGGDPDERRPNKWLKSETKGGH